VWEVLAHYTAQLVLTLVLTLCPRRVVLGGGPLAGRPALLLPAVRRHYAELLGGYLASPPLPPLDELIVASAAGSDAGLLGALHLAALAIHKVRERETRCVSLSCD
jgi:fructokinase